MDKKILREKSPQLNKIAKGMVLCRTEARRYAICVSGKGLTVNQRECEVQFTSLMQCLGRRVKK
jgi:hypothetical protein